LLRLLLLDGGGVGGGTEAVGLTARTCWATVAETAGMVAAGRRPGPFCAEVGLLLLLIKTLGWDGAPTGKFNRVSGWEGGAGAGAGRTGGGSAELLNLVMNWSVSAKSLETSELGWAINDAG